MNIYANRVLKSSVRKDTESVTKEKGEASPRVSPFLMVHF